MKNNITLFCILTSLIFLSINKIEAKNTNEELKSNHSFSTTILGLEYSYERIIADNWAIIGRIGAVPVGFNYTHVGLDVAANVGFGLSLESRKYFKNATSFVSFRMRANTVDGIQLSFTPAYGLRKSFGKLWFHELTAGVKIGQTAESPIFIGPHLQYRIGISF